MRRSLSILVGAGALVAGALASGPLDAATPARIVDRTFVCTPGQLYGSLRALSISTKPRGSLGNGGRSDDISPGYVSVGSGLARGPFDDLIHARSRVEQRRTTPNRPWQAGVYADARRCAAARATAPLSAKGLPGPPIRFDRETDCEVRGRIIVRVRAVLEAPTLWRPADTPYAGARGNVVEATIAVRGERSRKPLAFMQLGRSGETKLWASPGCA